MGKGNFIAKADKSSVGALLDSIHASRAKRSCLDIELVECHMKEQPAAPGTATQPDRTADTKLDESLWVWGTSATEPRLLHTMVRVRDLDRSLKFYCDGLGMRVLSRFDSEQGRFSLRFLSFTDFASGPAIELTHNWDQAEDYTHGSGYGHIAIGVPDIHAACKRLAEAGGTVTTPPKHMVPGAPALAFVKDPDGYPIELIQTRHG